ncbi:MAG: DUF4376 domain-containing protein [Sneathiella sp.]
MKARVINNYVVEVLPDDAIVHPDLGFVTAPAETQIGWYHDGHAFMAPPDHPSSQWDGSVWSTPKPLLFAENEARRKTKENGGMTTSAGFQVATDSESQGKMGDAVAYLKEMPPATQIDFAISDQQFAQLDLTSLMALSLEVAAYVQGCFTKQKEVAGMIEADAITSLQQLNDEWQE